MPPRKLHNYLRTHRKRLGLSQKEIAYLLGCSSGAKVSRYERSARQPGLQTILAYAVIFQNPTHELYAGEFQGIRATTIRRVRLLARRLEKEKPTQLATRKLEALRSILEKHSNPFSKNS